MSFKTKALVAAMALAAIGSANATLKFGGSTTQGNSSLSFVAMSADNSTSLVVDLGYQLSDMLAGGALRAATGAADGTVTTASWNLQTGAVTLNGATVAGTFAYSNAATFLTANTDARWGVIAADGIGGAVSGVNKIASQNILFTSQQLDFDNSQASGVTNAAVANGAGNVTQLFANNNTVTGSTHTAGKFGSSVANAGGAFLGTTVAVDGVGTFGQQIGMNDFMNAVGETAYVMTAQLNAPLVNISQLGGRVDSLGTAITDVATASQFTFDGTTLTYNTAIAAAVPEPGTYAMLLAGLGAVGFMARRRKSA